MCGCVCVCLPPPFIYLAPLTQVLGSSVDLEKPIQVFLVGLLKVAFHCFLPRLSEWPKIVS